MCGIDSQMSRKSASLSDEAWEVDEVTAEKGLIRASASATFSRRFGASSGRVTQLLPCSFDPSIRHLYTIGATPGLPRPGRRPEAARHQPEGQTGARSSATRAGWILLGAGW